MIFIHELEDAEELFIGISEEMKIDPYLVEKDYWIMHALWGLKEQGYDFELKGGTSLSKAFKIINRFSEDIDIKILPKPGENVPSGRNQNDQKHIEKRETFFDNLSNTITISGMQTERDVEFDDEKFRSAGIRLTYNSFFEVPESIKNGILLEVGFDTTTPNESLNIDSWAFTKAGPLIPDLRDNRAIGIKCYLPEYTFVEKLQAITRKVRQQQEYDEFGSDFLRHFYDIHMLFQEERIRKFITTPEYLSHKNERFRGKDNPNLSLNLAFNLDSDPSLLAIYEQEFLKIHPLLISGVPSFTDTYASIIQIREIG